MDRQDRSEREVSPMLAAFALGLGSTLATLVVTGVLAPARCG